MQGLIPKTMNGGLTAMINVKNTGLENAITHVAFGDANGSGYAPDQSQTALVNERARTPIGGGERAGPFEIIVEALLDTGPTFDIYEVGFVLADGTLLAIWSDPNFALLVKTIGIPLAVSYNLALTSIPADTLTLNISGPSVNLTIAGPLASFGASLMRHTRRITASDVDRLIPTFSNQWR